MKILPANRVFLILGIIVTIAGAAATYVAGVTNSLPASWQGNAAIIVTILGGIAGVITAVVKFLDGEQKSEALQAQARTQTKSPAGPPPLAPTVSASGPMTLWTSVPPATTTTVTASPPQPERAPEPQPEPPPEPEPEVDESAFAPRPEGQTDDKGWRPTSAMAAQAQPNELAPKQEGQA